MTEDFFYEFLTSTERIMLAKRIVCQYLLYKKISISNISETIKVSTATVAKYKFFMEQNTTMQEIFKSILREEKFIRLIDAFANEYLKSPPTLSSLLNKDYEHESDYEKRKRSPI